MDKVDYLGMLENIEELSKMDEVEQKRYIKFWKMSYPSDSPNLVNDFSNLHSTLNLMSE